MIEMKSSELAAFNWALSQKFESVAARHARTLAEFIERARQNTKEAEQRVGVDAVVNAQHTNAASVCGQASREQIAAEMLNLAEHIGQAKYSWIQKSLRDWARQLQHS